MKSPWIDGLNRRGGTPAALAYGSSAFLPAFRLLAFLLAAPLFSHAAATPPPPPPERLDGKTWEERATALVRYVAKQRPDRNNETYPKASAPAYAARLILGVDTEYALQKLDASVSSRIARAQATWKADPKSSHALDPFDKVALVNTYFLAKDKIPAATAA